MPVATRKSVPVERAEYDLVQRLREPGSPEQEAVRAAGVELSERPSEAEALHALLVVGRRALDEQLLEMGYAALAASEDEEDRQVRRELRRRAERLADSP
jgi:hypothetical protein